MKITFLVDSNTTIDQYYQAEPALSVLVQDGKTRILLDTGYSDAFLLNAQKMGIDLCELDWLVFSHGHFDHTWGLPHLIRHYTEERIRGRKVIAPTVLAHPIALEDKISPELGSIGSFFNKETLERFFPVELSREPKWLTERILYLGEIPEQLDFEKAELKNERSLEDGTRIPDDLIDDTSLALLTDKGLVLLTGCAHSGVCSTLARAMELTGEKRVVDVLGGFHLLNASEKRLLETVRFLKEAGVTKMSPCHCVDQAAKCALASEFHMLEVGSGSSIEWE